MPTPSQNGPLFVYFDVHYDKLYYKPSIFWDLRTSHETLLRTVQEMVDGNVQQTPSYQAAKIWNHLAKEE